MTMEMSLKSLSPIGMPTRTWTRPLYWLLDLLGASNLILDMDVLCGIDEELGMHDRWSNARGGGAGVETAFLMEFNWELCPHSHMHLTVLNSLMHLLTISNTYLIGCAND